MNDRYALSALLESPGFLLQELGIGDEVFVYRPRGSGDRSGFVSCEKLGEDIANMGRGFLFRKGAEGQLAIIRFVDPYFRPYRCLFIEFDYASSGGGAYFFCLREEQEDERVFFCLAESLLQLELLPIEAGDELPSPIIAPCSV